MDEHVFGKGGEVGELVDSVAVLSESRWCARRALHALAPAQVGIPAEAFVAHAAEYREAGDDVVSGFDVVDHRANRFDNSCGLVTQDGGHGKGVLAFHIVEVAVADARGHSADHHLVGTWVIDLDIFDGQGGIDFAQYGCSHGLPPK